MTKGTKPPGLKFIAIGFMVTLIAGIFDRVLYIRFLYQNGYDYKQVFVPWKLFWDYHLTFPGSLLGILCAGPPVLAILFLSILKHR